MAFLGGLNQDLKVNDVVGGLGISDGDITDSDNSNTIYDITNEHIPTTILESDSVGISTGNGIKNISGGSLGGNISFDIAPADFAGSFISTDGSDNLDVNLGSTLKGDGNGNIVLDESSDFTFTSTVGIDSGLIGPQDSFTDLINVNVGTSPTAGTKVGYSFSLDQQSIISIDGEADGSGGIQNTVIDVSKSITDTDASNTIYDKANNHVPLSVFEENTITFDLSNSTETIKLGETITIDSGGGTKEFDVITVKDLLLHQQTLESSKTETIASNESNVTSGQYDLNGTLNLNGSMTIV